MHRLVAVVANHPGFVGRLRRAWDDGDAVFPLDPRLAPAAAADTLAAVGAACVVDAMDATSALPDAVPVLGGDALVVATSGTTGVPRGVVLTHDAVAASAWATSSRLGVDPGRDRWLACLPLAHVGGLSVVTRALVTSTPLEAHPDGFDRDRALDAARRGATLVSLVPTALARIDAAAFRLVVLGGATPPASLPANCVTTYGMTETGSGVVYDGLPLDGVEARVDGDGVVWLRGPMLLRAYRVRNGGPEGVDPRGAGGWFRTGDAGEWAGGRLRVLGRVGDLVVTGGEKVWPDAVERVLAAVEGVAEVAVAGRPDPEWGQRLVAYVVPADPARPPTLAALRDAVKATLAAYAAPRELVVVGALPRTALGKVRRGDLGGGAG